MKKDELKSPSPEWSRFKDALEFKAEAYNPNFEDIEALINCKSYNDLPSFWAGLAEELYNDIYNQ